MLKDSVTIVNRILIIFPPAKAKSRPVAFRRHNRLIGDIPEN